jgi:tetratricopeptide (TPR) repeat protein
MVACLVHAKDGSTQDSACILASQVDSLVRSLTATIDSDTYYATLSKVFLLAQHCDGFDAAPDIKGKVKLRFRKKHRSLLLPLVPQLVAGARYFGQAGMSSKTLDLLTEYVALSTSPLTQGVALPDLGWAALWAGQLAYSRADFMLADRMAEVALQDSLYASQAAEVKIRCMREMMETPLDSARYVIALLELHDKAPENEGYFRMLTDYFTRQGYQQMESFAIDETTKDSTNKLAWAYLGEVKMKAHQWQAAIDAFQRAFVLDSTFVEAAYNLGVCYSAQAQTLQAGAERPLSDSCMNMLSQAKQYLEMVRRHEDRISIDWVKPLYQVYLMLGEKDKAQLLEQRINSGTHVGKNL